MSTQKLFEYVPDTCPSQDLLSTQVNSHPRNLQFSSGSSSSLLGDNPNVTLELIVQELNTARKRTEHLELQLWLATNERRRLSSLKSDTSSMIQILTSLAKKVEGTNEDVKEIAQIEGSRTPQEPSDLLDPFTQPTSCPNPQKRPPNTPHLPRKLDLHALMGGANPAADQPISRRTPIHIPLLPSALCESDGFSDIMPALKRPRIAEFGTTSGETSDEADGEPFVWTSERDSSICEDSLDFGGAGFGRQGHMTVEEARMEASPACTGAAVSDASESIYATPIGTEVPSSPHRMSMYLSDSAADEGPTARGCRQWGRSQ